MVQALFTLTGSLQRASRRSPAASALALLYVIAAHDKIRPSEIAAELDLHQSTITRHVQSLEESGYVTLLGDPKDRRSCMINLTDAGRKEFQRLNEIGLGRFELFVAGWDAEEVRTFTRLLTKLEVSKAELARREQRSGGRRWQGKDVG